MIADQFWWQEQAENFLSDTLAFINNSRSRDDPVDRYGDLCKALNKTWNAYYSYRRRIGNLTEQEQKTRSDAQGFRQLLLSGINPTQACEFCLSQRLRALAEVTPQIMNHDTLLKEGYDPLSISGKLRKEASEEHSQFVNAYTRYRIAPTDEAIREALLRKTEQILYVVRSNLMHSEKTTKGPDLEKATRDCTVCGIAARVADDFLEVLFDHPSQRLAVYGTLAPGKPNASLLAGIAGDWYEGKVTGEMDQRYGLPIFTWMKSPNVVSVQVLVAPDLPVHLERLDEFEGPRYRRILVPVLLAGRTVVCNIFEGAS